jgi:hypothetical protein
MVGVHRNSIYPFEEEQQVGSLLAQIMAAKIFVDEQSHARKNLILYAASEKLL